jgi:hypothetical protein
MESEREYIGKAISRAIEAFEQLGYANWANVLVDKYGPSLEGMVVSDPEKCPIYALFGSWIDGLRVIKDHVGNDTYLAAVVADDDDPKENDRIRSLWLEAVNDKLDLAPTRIVYLVEGEPYAGTLADYAKALEEASYNGFDVSTGVWAVDNRIAGVSRLAHVAVWRHEPRTHDDYCYTDITMDIRGQTERATVKVDLRA